MSRFTLVLVAALLVAGPGFAILGCADDIKTTRTITTYEEDPPRMVSPGSEVVE